jgi:hypothetical protein
MSHKLLFGMGLFFAALSVAVVIAAPTELPAKSHESQPPGAQVSRPEMENHQRIGLRPHHRHHHRSAQRRG